MTMLRLAADVLSGPDGLASWLRRSQLGGDPGGGPSLPLGVALPLDTGEAGPSIPAHLRRAVTIRHIHCAFPGCRVPAAACHIHHLVPRASGGATTVGNLVPLCGFHHLTAVHRWGWALTLHADGSVTAASPDRARTLHDHGPPAGPDLPVGQDRSGGHGPPSKAWSVRRPVAKGMATARPAPQRRVAILRA